MPTLLPQEFEKENPAKKWGNLVAKNGRAVGSKSTQIFVEEAAPNSCPGSRHWLPLRNLIP
jgi:hypothetical protein